MHARNLPGVTSIRRLFRVSDPHGLHARPAALIVGVAIEFDADVFLQHGTAVAIGKSLLALLTLCVGPGELLTIVAQGIDADRLMDVLENLFQRHAFMISV